MDKYRHIVVEGPIGVGKTSLARRLAEHWNAGLLLEQPEQNPFLARFYQEMERYALPTQLFFLFQRVNQMRELRQIDMFSQVTVADFLLDKDPLFARLNLSNDEFHLYQQIYATLSPQAPQPDLVIYLQAQAETLVERVRRRGADYEQPISESYLAQVADAYNRFFYHHSGTPVLIVNSERLNFVDRAADFELLLERIAGMRGQREYFNMGD